MLATVVEDGFEVLVCVANFLALTMLVLDENFATAMVLLLVVGARSDGPSMHHSTTMGVCALG